jgi:glyoxylase-like metal-dependent hydrolase (beta-lactamase superfamily II)
MTCVYVKYLRVGQCRHLECIAARGGKMSMIDFPSFCGLIRHPVEGWILFDTGYADHFFEATKSFPEKLYRLALPIKMNDEEKLLAQLAQMGINAEDIHWIIVSHYHGDHIAGLRDFPNAKFVASKKDTDDLQSLMTKPFRATTQGKLPGLLPDDYFQKLIYADNLPLITLPQWMQPFTQAFDLFGDQSLLIIPLPGHSHGQIGLLIMDADGRPVFLTADACWSLPACREGRLPSLLARFATANNQDYQTTFFQLSELAKRETAISILPSHCIPSWASFNKKPDDDKESKSS